MRITCLFAMIFAVILNLSLYTNFPYIYLFIFVFHNKDYTSMTLYKDVARRPQETTRLVRGGPLVTIILSNRNRSTHNNGGYKKHYRYNKKSKTFVLNDCNKKSKLLSLVKNFKFLGLETR